jgi:circadian clock protein KaiC
MDAWLLLQNIEGDGERNRGLYVLKSRGMAHSNQIREFLISGRGIDLVDAYIGPGGMLVGAARSAQTAREKAAALASQQAAMRVRRTLDRKHSAVERQIATLRSDYEAEAQEVRCADGQAVTRTPARAMGRTGSVLPHQSDAPGGLGASAHGNGSRRRR